MVIERDDLENVCMHCNATGKVGPVLEEKTCPVCKGACWNLTSLGTLLIEVITRHLEVGSERILVEGRWVTVGPKLRQK